MLCYYKGSILSLLILWLLLLTNSLHATERVPSLNINNIKTNLAKASGKLEHYNVNNANGTITITDKKEPHKIVKPPSSGFSKHIKEELEKEKFKSPAQKAMEAVRKAGLDDPKNQEFIRKLDPKACFINSVQYKLDACGVCHGDNKTCLDCKGVPNGGHIRDQDKKCCRESQTDCRKMCFGTAALDCNNECNGKATINECGICVMGKTGKAMNHSMDCNNICFGTAYINECNVCVGGSTGVPKDSKKGCDGVCFSEKIKDDCGICGGNGAMCRDCHGIRFDAGGDRHLVQDACMVCGGDNSSCSGCDRVPWSGKEVDKCGICGGSNECCGGAMNCNNNNGICSSSVRGCICNPGWTGPYCTIKQEACLYMNCGHNGRCSEQTSKCVCDLGWIGDKCDMKSCSGHGIYSPDSQECECFSGYSGSNCDQCAVAPEGQIYVCILTPEKYFKKPTGGYDEDGPLKFVLGLMEVREVWPALYGVHILSRGEDELVILPAALYEDFVYGCDCLPAHPFVDTDYQGPMNELVRDIIKQNQFDNNFGTTVDFEKYVKRGPFVTHNEDGIQLKTMDSPFARFEEIPYSGGRVTLRFKLFGKTKNDMEPLSLSETVKNIGEYRYSMDMLSTQEVTDPLVPIRRKMEQERNMVHVLSRTITSVNSNAKTEWAITMIIFFVFLISMELLIFIGVLWMLVIRSSIDILKSAIDNVTK